MNDPMNGMPALETDPLQEYGKPTGQVMDREAKTPPDEEAAFVKEWVDRINRAKVHWGPNFTQMRKNTKFVRGQQWSDDATDDRYVANLTLRHINQRVAQIYARNPKVVARRKARMEFKIWDGDAEKISGARAVMQASLTGEVDQTAAQRAQILLADFQEGMARRQQMTKIARTLEYVAQFSLDEPTPKFKLQLKQLVRRVATCRVGYIKLGYQRLLSMTPELEARIKDTTDQISRIEMLAADVADEVIKEGDAKREELKLALKALQDKANVVLREGILFDFPRAWSLIIDPAMVQLKGFVGAEWLAQEYTFSPDRVKQIYKLDVGEQFRAYDSKGGDAKGLDKKCRVWECYDLVSGLSFTLCEGYPCYLKAPAAPDIKLDQGHPFYALTFNDLEDDENPFPPSDSEIIAPMQKEHNRTREAMRQHRIANKPAMMGPKGALGADTKTRLATHEDNEYIEYELPPTMKIGDAIVAKPTVAIDPNLYQTGPIFEDVLRSTGDQEASLGGTSGSTATEVSVAENTRSSNISSNVDDLDEFLTDVMRGVGQVLLLEMSPETVKKIVGPGAMWPELSREEVSNELYLEVRAGSSGRPNRSTRLSAREKIMPLLLQIPGVKAEPLAKDLLLDMDDTIEVEDYMDPGALSMTAQNGMKGPMEGAPTATGGAMAQGPAGAQNAPKPTGSPAQPQNQAPAPTTSQPGAALTAH